MPSSKVNVSAMEEGKYDLASRRSGDLRDDRGYAASSLGFTQIT